MRATDLTPSQMAELEALASMADEDIDTSDIPEIKEFSNPRRGMFSGSPNRKAKPKVGLELPRESGNSEKAPDARRARP